MPGIPPQAYSKFHDKPEVMEFRLRLETYNTLLKQYHLHDHQVKRLNRYTIEAVLLLMYAPEPPR